MENQQNQKQIEISKVDVTHDKISGRGGIYFVLRYIETISFYQRFEKFFNFLSGSAKGLSPLQFLKQIFGYFMDGSDMSMKSFDRRKQDEAYAALLENTPDEMASSHQIKRCFRKFILVGNWLFRKILLQLFIWRLHIEQPDIIELNHQRGAGEINHRAVKEFATKEQLPFERLGMNRAYYYLMLISYFLQVAYKYDVAAELLPLTSYPTTFRRQLIDFAAKIVASGGEFILKVTQLIYDHLNIRKIWELSGAPPPIPIT